MYQWSEDMNHHANVFAHIVDMSIDNHVKDTNGFRFAMAKQHIDKMYNWDTRAQEWTGLLRGLEKKFDM